MALSHTHFLYAVIEREFRKSGEQVVKYGRTGAGLAQRMAQYPKGSVMLCAFAVEPALVEKAEIALLTSAREKFKACPEIGREYFYGEIMAMTHHLVLTGAEFRPNVSVEPEPEYLHDPKGACATETEAASDITKWLAGVARDKTDRVIFDKRMIGALCDAYDTNKGVCTGVL